MERLRKATSFSTGPATSMGRRWLVAPVGMGTTYELSPAHGQWSLSVLHTFTDHSDGGEPGNGAIFDQAGNLYGTTVSGGSDNNGVVYELTPGSSGWTQTILHNFAGGSSDGAIGAE